MRRPYFLAGLIASVTFVAWLGGIAAAAENAPAKPAAQQAAPAQREFQSPLAKIELGDGDTLVFLGDSITHQCLYTQYVEDYFYTRFPKARIRFHNSGVGGDRAADALIRFEPDVAAYKPKYVTILLGMNDGTYRPYDDAVFQLYRRDMTELVKRIEGIGAKAVLMTPTMFDARAKRMRDPKAPPEPTALYNSTLAYYGAWLREIAVEGGHGFVDMYSPLNNLTVQQRKTDPKFTLIRDAVHPDAPGQLIMAAAVLSDMGVPRQMSMINIRPGTGGEAIVKASGGKVSDARYTDEGLEFTFAAASLPLVVPAEAQPGAKLMNLGHKLSREAVELHGLQPGTYELRIDGQAVGKYPSTVLERFVELENNAQTPQYKQALAVAELNKQRNDEVVRPLRNLWSSQKGLRRAKNVLDANPNDPKLQQAYQAMQKKLATFDQQLAAINAQLKSFEDRIYAANQPQPHKYQLVRVGELK